MTKDSDLQLAVLAALNWEPSLAPARIGVTASHGVVTLSGHVDSFVQKHAAENAAIRVKGVLAVAEELEVDLPFDRQRGDDDIAATALDRLAWDTSVPRQSLHLSVEKGWITLTGSVDWHYQKQAAEAALRTLVGVVGISNQLVINPHLNSANIGDDILHALHRSWFFDPRTIKVTAHNGDVRLTGTVTSWHDRRLAAETAWAARGVTSVENDLTVV